MTVELNGSNSLTLNISFPDQFEDFEDTTLDGTIIERIVNSGDERLGGIYFEVEETDTMTPLPDKIEIQTLAGETKMAYAIFLESSGDRLNMVLHLIEKDESPIEYEFKAIKQ